MTEAATRADPGPRLAALWQAVVPRMADLPIFNGRLDVHATRFRRHGDWRVGVVVTPWFMNVIAVPDNAAALPPLGSVLRLDMPVGLIDAVSAALDGFGGFASASLFSPMDGFDDPVIARGVAEAALDALFEPPAPPPPKQVGRRALFGGRQDATV